MNSGDNMRDIQMVLERWGVGQLVIVQELIIPLSQLALKGFFLRQVKHVYHAPMMMPLS